MSYMKFNRNALVGRGQGNPLHYMYHDGSYAASGSYGPSNSPRHDVTDHGKSAAEKAKELGIMLSRPKHPEFAVKALRLKTFDSWPSYIHQRPEDLVEAGFFYSGKDDSVFCFYCGQGLHSWEPQDVPWVEHAKWYPECVFVLTVKGKDFVEMVKRDQIDGTCLAMGTDGQPSQGKLEHVLESNQQKNGLFETPAVQSLILNGYNEESIKRSVEIWIKMKGTTDFSASDILQVIFELEEGNIRYEDYITNAVEKPAISDSPADSESHTNPDNNNHSDQDNQQKSYEAQLKEENKSLKGALMCKICHENQVCVVFLPCGHVVCCEICAPAMKHCPSCQQFVKGTIKTYLV